MAKVIATLILLFSTAALAAAPSASSSAVSPAPEFQFELNGQLQSLHQLSQQRYVYVDFWASWCGPCRYSFPFMNQLHQQLGDKLTVVAVNVDVDPEDAKPFLEKYPADFTIHYNPDSDIADAFKVRGMPSSYLIKDGNIVLKHVGFRKSKAQQTFDEIDAIVRKP